MGCLKYLKKNDGASAILVIIMMVVLLVFGLAVLTTSLSNVRLGERKRVWLSEYYELEAAGAKALADIDQILIQAAQETKTYMSTDAYMDDYMLDGPIDPSTKAQLFALAYDDAMMLAISEAIAGQEHMVFYHGEQDLEAVLSGQPLKSSWLDFSISLPDSLYDKHLQVSVDLLTASEENLTEDLSLTKRYTLTRHTQQQDAFQYEDNLDFEADPFEEDTTDSNPFAE